MFCKLLLVCGLCCTASARRSNFFSMKEVDETGCKYKGYFPGGKVDSVDKIDTKQAVIAKKAIAAILGKASQAAVLTAHGAAGAKAFLGVMEDSAGKLGSVLGIFSVATGVIKSLTEVKPQQILDACNTAIGELTQDMNNRLEAMKGYVNKKVIDLEKRLMKDSYEKYYILWRNCVDEPTASDRAECQRKAYAEAASALPEFAVYDDELLRGRNLDAYKSRELEASLFAFRDYANLILMMLKPLVQIYNIDKSAEGVKQYARYSKHIKQKTDFFIKYAIAAVKSINNAHQTTPCTKTFECSPQSEIWEGTWIFKAHTANTRICTCIMDDGTKQECKLKTMIRVDGHNSYTSRMLDCPDESWDCATKALPKKIMGWRTWTYELKDKTMVSAFWRKQILDIIPAWRMAYDVPKNARRDAPSNVLSDEPDIFFDEEPDEKPGAERRQKARLAKAEKELNMLHKHI